MKYGEFNTKAENRNTYMGVPSGILHSFSSTLLCWRGTHLFKRLGPQGFRRFFYCPSACLASIVLLVRMLPIDSFSGYFKKLTERITKECSDLRSEVNQHRTKLWLGHSGPRRILEVLRYKWARDYRQRFVGPTPALPRAPCVSGWPNKSDNILFPDSGAFLPAFPGGGLCLR